MVSGVVRRFVLPTPVWHEDLVTLAGDSCASKALGLGWLLTTENGFCFEIARVIGSHNGLG